MVSSADFTPKASIVIPVYNGSNYLREAVDSALNQTYRNIEVIVVNDGSNDSGKTKEIAKSYGKRIRYFYKENGGVASALNLGIRNMKGEYFSWLSHDDVYYPSKIEEQIKYLRDINRDDIIIYSDFELIDTNSKFIKDVRLGEIEPKKIIAALLYESFMHGCTLLIPRKCFQDEMLFNENLRSTQDYDLWFRLSMNYNFVHLDKVLIKSRQHSGQGIRTLRKSHFKECNDFFLSWMKQLEQRETEYFIIEPKSLYFAALSYSFLRRGFFYPMLLSMLISIKNLNLKDINDVKKKFRDVLKYQTK